MSAPRFPHTASRRSFLAEPQGWLAFLIGAQLFLWTLVPWLLATSLPLDVVSDGLSWGHEWQWGYYKHPPLPSWTVELFFDGLGDLGPFLLSQIAIAATYGFVFLLGREIMPVRWAAVGTLLLAGVYYFSIPSPEYNHNVAQMPVWAAASFFYFKAWKTARLRWWFALGVCAGLGLLTKYPTGLLLATMVAHLASTRNSRSAFASPGPYLAIATCIAIIAPHLLWLYGNGFPTIHYAVARAGNEAGAAARFFTPFKFLAAQAIDISPALLAAAIAGLFAWDRAHLRRDENLRFLLWLTLGPPVLTFVASLATGLGIRDMWGAPMWNLTGLILVQAAVPGRDSVSLPRLKICVAALFVIGLAGYALANAFVPQLENRPSRIQWPDRELAQTFTTIWQTETHRPLRIVAADGWLGGLIAMRADPRPSVWIDASYAKAPWITTQAVARDGALIVWRVKDGPQPPAAYQHLPGLEILGVKSFAWPRTPKALPLRIGYGIVMPEGASR